MDLNRLNELGFEKTPLWMSIVLGLSSSFWWNIFITLQCCCVFFTVTSLLGYNLDTFKLTVFIYIMDFIFLFDIIIAVAYKYSRRLKMLKYCKRRNLTSLVLDFLSVIPLELAFRYYYIAEVKNDFLGHLFLQNRALRISRLFLLNSNLAYIIRTSGEHIFYGTSIFIIGSLIIGHFFAVIWFNVEKSFACNEHSFDCYFWHEINMITVALHSWSGNAQMFKRLEERIIVCFAVLSGFFLIFCYLYPSFLFIVLQLSYKNSLFYEKNERIEAFLNNMVQKSELRYQIKSYFNNMWDKGEESFDFDSLFKNIPNSLKKEVFTDVYWEAFRHSRLLRSVSRNFKRALSLLMKTEYYPPGEVIYRKGQEKLQMIYLVEGVIQIMAEENEESPLVSLSAGSVLGEVSLFLYTRSRAIVRSKGYCEVQLLTMKAMSSILKDFPKDKKLVLYTFKEKMLMAQHTQWRKQQFVENQSDGLQFCSRTIEDMKWLKGQWRTLWEIRKRQIEIIKAQEQGTKLGFWQKTFHTEPKIEFISNQLDLIALTDTLGEKEDCVCLRMNLPWSINPSSQFLKIWFYINMLTSLIPAIVYPFCTGWLNTFPFAVYVLSYVVTLIFIIDVIFKLHTAVKSKHGFKTNFSEVLTTRMQELSFFLDVIAAIPFQIYIIKTVNYSTATSYEVGLPLHPAILKCVTYLFISVPVGRHIDGLRFLKNTFILLLLVYWFSELVQLHSIRLIWTDHSSWVDRNKNSTMKMQFIKHFASVIKVLIIATQVPDDILYSEGRVDLIGACSMSYFFFMFISYFLGDFYEASVIKMFSEESFRLQTRRAAELLKTKKIADQKSSTILKSIQFQWSYDKADYISSNVCILNLIPANIRRNVHLNNTYEILKLCPLLKEESTECIMDIIQRSDLLAVPSGSVLITYGHTNHTVSIIRRGYCQFYSFLTKDVKGEYGTPLIIGPGAIFPFLSIFCNLPSISSVITVTDCELLMIDFNDLLNVMIKYKIFKDVMDVIKENDLVNKLKDSKPALVKLNLKPMPKSGKIHSRYGLCAKILNLLCSCRNRFAGTKFFIYWDGCYCIFTCFFCVLGPCTYGLLVYYSDILVPALIVLKIVVVLHMIFRCHNPYYSSKGLLISHPVYTLLNYFTSSFVLDFFRILPLYPIFHYVMSEPGKKPGYHVIVADLIHFTLDMLEIMKYLNHLETEVDNKYRLVVTEIFLGLFFCFNLFINLMIYMHTEWTFGSHHKVIKIELKDELKLLKNYEVKNASPWDLYILFGYWAVNCWNSIDFSLNHVSESQLCISVGLSVFGILGNIIIYSYICLSSVISVVSAALYREKVISLTNFLKREKASEQLIELVYSYYRHQWRTTKEGAFKQIFKHLPLYLNEELWYPLYRPTFIKNSIFEGADEGFFKILAVNVTSISFTRGSVIIFQNEAQSFIYFIHKGKCFVYDWFLLLEQGSMVGDISRTGLMKNKVYALTHVEMLQIPSKEFFTIINSYDDLEANYLYVTQRAESFIKSDVYRVGYEIRPIDSKDVVNAFDLKKKKLGFEDMSHFEDPENPMLFFKDVKIKKKKRLFFFPIYPRSWENIFFIFFRYLNVVFTFLCTLTFHSFGGLTNIAFGVIGFLDLTWLIIILVTFHLAIEDKENGDVITHFNYIALRYLKRYDGLVIDLIGLLPLELIVVGFSDGSPNFKLVSYLRMVRFIRAYSLFRYIGPSFSNRKFIIFGKCCLEIFAVLTIVIIFTNIFISITKFPSIVAAKDPNKFTKEQLYAFILAFEYTVNLFACSNLFILDLSSSSELIFFIVISWVFIYLKAQIIRLILSVLYVQNFTFSYYKSQKDELITYLKRKQTSPILIQEVVDYKTNLLLYGRSENMPSLLFKAPMCIQMAVMKNLFMHHLIECPLFQNIDKTFLCQLATRLRKETYFPGQKIVEQGDVDYQMYFIHLGEVYVITQTDESAYVEKVIGKMTKGQFFGASQLIRFIKPHKYTYRGRSVVEVLVLHANSWKDLRQFFPDAVEKIYNNAVKLKYI